MTTKFRFNINFNLLYLFRKLREEERATRVSAKYGREYRGSMGFATANQRDPGGGIGIHVKGTTL